MKMTPALLVIGGLMVFWASVTIAVFLPSATLHDAPSDIWKPMDDPDVRAGAQLYIRNGCSYCHSRYVRVLDWDVGAERIAEKGDYYGEQPAILGTERTGPDLSQEAGEHPDDWHLAHFINPRITRPVSLMPAWEFLGRDEIRQLTAFMQFMGGKMGDPRVERQKRWKEPAQAAYKAGPDKNVQWLHDQIPRVWQAMPNPYPATKPDLLRGEKIYQQECINCHGPVGDGQTVAANYMDPPPLNFTILRGHLVEGKYIGGIFYYQIMNGITGTAMPYFKRDLESEKIWDLSNYIAVQFLGYTDATIEPRGIPAAYENPWKNDYQRPVPQEAK